MIGATFLCPPLPLLLEFVVHKADVDIVLIHRYALDEMIGERSIFFYPR